MYKLLIFDADHTLWDFDKAEKNAICKIFVDSNIPFENSYLEVYREINFSLWKLFEQNEISQKKIKTERFRLFFEKIGFSADYSKISHDYLIYLSQGNELLDGAFELITDLKSRYMLALLTNGISIVQHPRYENSRLFGSFSAFVVSGDLGINKPDKAIFEYTLDKCNISDKSEVLMIGDSLSSDIQGGLNSGIDTCWYNPKGSVNNTPFKPKYEIMNLNEIYHVLEESI